jgi:hypothetical protein
MPAETDLTLSIMMNYSKPDLTQHAPRSIRVRLGGYVHLARLLDKARAVAAGKGGEYQYNCPLDQRFFAFTRIKPAAFMAKVKAGKTDYEMLEWVNAQSKRRGARGSRLVVVAREPRAGRSQRARSGSPAHRKGKKSKRDDIRSFADRLDLDDYITYGGKA